MEKAPEEREGISIEEEVRELALKAQALLDVVKERQAEQNGKQSDHVSKAGLEYAIAYYQNTLENEGDLSEVLGKLQEAIEIFENNEEPA
jgi:hypothetical protein